MEDFFIISVVNCDVYCEPSEVRYEYVYWCRSFLFLGKAHLHCSLHKYLISFTGSSDNDKNHRKSYL